MCSCYSDQLCSRSSILYSVARGRATVPSGEARPNPSLLLRMQSPSPAGLAARRRPRRRTQRPPSPSPSDRASQSGGLYIALARRTRRKVYPWYPPLLWPQFPVPVVTATNLGPWELGFDGQPDTREAEGRRLDARYLGRFVGWLRLLEDGKLRCHSPWFVHRPKRTPGEAPCASRLSSCYFGRHGCFSRPPQTR